MGLSIIYSGRIRNMALLPGLTKEAFDLFHDLHWHYDIYQPTDVIPLKGFWFCPPGADKIWFTFLQDGTLADPGYYVTKRMFQDPLPKAGDVILLYPSTQYAGAEAHMELIRLIRYLSNKYFVKFRLRDDSEFWETGNEEKCRDWFEMFAHWMNNMSVDLGALDGRGYETGQNFQTRVEDLLRGGKSMIDILKVMGSPYRK